MIKLIKTTGTTSGSTTVVGPVGQEKSGMTGKNEELRGPFLAASAALEEIWKERQAVNPFDNTGLVISQCKLLQMQLLAVIMTEGWDRARLG